jgi:hypothetical protein
MSMLITDLVWFAGLLQICRWFWGGILRLTDWLEERQYMHKRNWLDE